MRKYEFAFMALTAMFSLSSCNKELDMEETVNGKTGTGIICASIETNGTKTSLSYNEETGRHNVIWSKNDTFILEGESFTLQNGEGKNSGEFSGKLPTSDGTYDAWYGTNGTSLPVVQTFRSGEITNSPMHAGVTVKDGIAGPMAFKNLCGLLRLSLKGSVTIKAITVSADQAVAGAFTVNSEGGAEMSAKGTSTYTTLKCANGVTLNTSTATDFYIAMPAGEYSNVKVEIADTGSRTHTKTLKTGTLLISRSTITSTSFDLGEFAAPLTINGHLCVKLAGYYWATENVGEVAGVTPKYAGTTNANYGCCYYYIQSDAFNAAENWGGTWELPTAAQWQALLDGCNWFWQENYKTSGKNGYLVTDKTDDTKSIFLPAAGYYWSSVEYLSTELLYWASDYDSSRSSDHGKYLYSYYVRGIAPYINYGNELTGFSVRAVASSL